MFTRRVVLASLILTAVVIATLLVPATAEAQRRGPSRGRHGQSVIMVGGGLGYPGYWVFDQWGDQWGPYGPYGPWGPYGPYRPYPRYYMVDEFSAAVRLDVKPAHAEVYVDGHYAGIVDNFDGIFQRLRLKPGEHELVLYLSGYRTLTERLYLQPHASQKIELIMERLAPGEMSGPPPTPPPAPIAQAPIAKEPPGRREIPREVRPEPTRPTEPVQPAEQRSVQFGALSIRVLPADAEVLVDGERWAAPAGQDRLRVQLSPGRHRVEVRKAGFATYAEEVLIRPGATLTLNVSLVKGP